MSDAKPFNPDEDLRKFMEERLKITKEIRFLRRERIFPIFLR
jgi:hypothetical protein